MPIITIPDSDVNMEKRLHEGCFIDYNIKNSPNALFYPRFQKGIHIMNDTKIQWHPGFVAAMNLELSENRKDVIYEKEYNLNTKPLEIDLLVIKKETNIKLTNEIGKLFRGHNIMEYKSPNDELNIDTFYKTGAYASLYKAYGETVNRRRADDITVSIVREKKPVGLFAYFTKHGIEISNPYAGIYYISGIVQFPTQIIVTKELDHKAHTWLKALSGNLKKQDMEELLKRISVLTGELDRELADSVLEVSIRANRKMIEELRGDDDMCKALLEIMEPEINKIVEIETKKRTEMEAEKNEKRGRILATVEILKEIGKSEEEIKNMLMIKYDLSDAETRLYLQ